MAPREKAVLTREQPRKAAVPLASRKGPVAARLSNDLRAPLSPRQVLQLQSTVGNQAVLRLIRRAPAGGSARAPATESKTPDLLEREANEVGTSIGAALGPGALTEGSLPGAARAVAERRLGPLPPVTVGEAADDGLASGSLASAQGSLIQFRPGALSSQLPFYRAALGHELVHVAQQQRLGPRTQHLMIGVVKVPDVTVSKAGDETILLIDRVPVLKAFGSLQVQTSYDESSLRYSISVRATEPVVSLSGLGFLNAMYPALAGQVVVTEPSMNLAVPREGDLTPEEAVPATSSRVFGVFGRVPGRSAAAAPQSPPATAPSEAPAPADAPPVTPAPAVPEAPAAESASPDETDLGTAGREANPYLALDVPARAAKVTELLERWLTSHEVLQVFQASSTDAEFLELEKATDFGAVLDKLSDWQIIRISAAGPILPEYSARVNRVRADYLARRAREWGPQRAEIFALFIIDTTTDDEIEAVLSLLAGDQELYRTVERMPTVAKRLADRGIDITKFQDRDWKAVDLATGVAHGLDSIMSTAPVVADSKGMEAFQQGRDLPEPYRQAVNDLDMAAFKQAFTPGNVTLAAADLAFLGLPSTVKGVVYDLPRSIVSGIDELSQGHVVAGVEQLTVPAIMLIGAALGIRAFRRARVAALLELTTEGKALYNSLKGSIGTQGIQRVAGYVQKDAAARILVAQTGAEGILALHTAKGDIAAARAIIAERQQLIRQAGDPSGVQTGMPGTPWARPHEVPYTPPPDLQIIRPGNPLRIESLNPAKRYLWVLDEQGNFRIAAEGQGNLFPKRGKLGRGHPQASETPLKHGDLVPGPEGKSRGTARAGGELRAELGADGKPTGRWIMNDDSSYAFARLDEVQLTRKELEAAHRLLGTTGTDTSKIVPKSIQEP